MKQRCTNRRNGSWPTYGGAVQNLANLSKAQSKFDQAEALYIRALSIFDQSIGPESSESGSVLDALSALYAAEGKYSDADPLYSRLLDLEAKTFGPQSLPLADTLDNYSQTLRKLGQDSKAADCEARAKSIRGAQPVAPRRRVSAKAGRPPD